MHLTSVKIKGFQAIRSLSFDVGKFTVFLGATHQGKSSILRAIESCLFNRAGSDFINAQSSQCAVQLCFDEDVSVVWVKGAGANRYSLNGDWYDKVATDVPEEVQDATGFREVVFDADIKERLHYTHQHAPAFLISPGAWTGAKVNRVLGKLSNAGPVFRAIRECNNDLRTLKRKIEEGEEEVESVQRRLDEIGELTAEEEQLENLAADMEEVNALRSRVLYLTSCYRSRNQIIDSITSLSSQKLSVSAAEVAKVKATYEQYSKVVDIYASYCRLLREVDVVNEGCAMIRDKFDSLYLRIEDWKKHHKVCPLCQSEFAE